MHKVFKERHVTDLVPHYHILQQHRVIDIQLIFSRILLVESHLHQTRQTTELDILGQSIVRIWQLMEEHEFLIA